MGYELMIAVAEKVYLATGPEGTTVACEVAIHAEDCPACPPTLPGIDKVSA
jgi:hypothetical protein